MIVYCDTSWLLSYLNEDDEKHSVARVSAGKLVGHDFVVCEVHLLELPAAVRAATHRAHDPVPEHIARRVINRFDRAVTGKSCSARTWTLKIRWRWPDPWGKRTVGKKDTPPLTSGIWRRRGPCPPEFF